MSSKQTAVTDEAEEYFRDLASKSLSLPFHPVVGRAVGGPTPEAVKAPYGPFQWPWKVVEPMVMKSAEIMKPGPEAHRRIVGLNNPLTPNHNPTHTINVAVQLVLPGEEAPSHHHTLTAIRFILRGQGITVVDGEPCTMAPGDLVLTPSWAWHGHANRTDEPVIWMDVLDGGLIRSLYASLYEDYPDGRASMQPASKAQDESMSRYGGGALRPAWDRSSPRVSPLMRYPWEQTERALHQAAQVEGSPFDDVALEFTNPLTGGHALPTLACGMQLLRPGMHTRSHRHSSSSVHQVFRGSGSTVVDGVQINWEEGDIFSLPPWSWHEHVNGSSTEEAIIFSTSDLPVLEALNLYWEDPYPEDDGYQTVHGTLGEA
ncbi:MAG: cupin domain-containing protein [Dehalococcoidia bacterium]